MAYVDESKCSSFNVIHTRPPTVVWTSELLREREGEELNYGGFRFGEIEGLFVEQEDPMPDNIEEKTGFEKTLDAAEYMFPRKLEGFFKRYVDALKYQGCRKEGSGNANISDENRAADAQADGQNNEGDNNILGDIGMDQGRVVDNIRVTSLRDKHDDVDMDQKGTVDDNILGSPTLYNMGPETQSLANELVDKLSNENRFGSPSLYNMGPETQKEVLRSVDDVDATIKRRKWVDMSDILSFSLGVTQDFALLDEDVVTPEANTHAPNLASEISNQLPLRPIPLRVCPPGTAVGRPRRDKDKRPVTISEVRKSPFIVYNTLLGREGIFQSFMGYVVNAIENNGKCELLKDIDVNLFPVDNGGHKFLFVADLKNSCALLIDHEKNEKIVRKRVKKKIGTCDNIKIAAMPNASKFGNKPTKVPSMRI
nr:C2 calcium-dependent membrane targeting [Tanacetum cinerariifolium]